LANHHYFWHHLHSSLSRKQLKLHVKI